MEAQRRIVIKVSIFLFLFLIFEYSAQLPTLQKWANPRRRPGNRHG